MKNVSRVWVWVILRSFLTHYFFILSVSFNFYVLLQTDRVVVDEFSAGSCILLWMPPCGGVLMKNVSFKIVWDVIF